MPQPTDSRRSIAGIHCELKRIRPMRGPGGQAGRTTGSPCLRAAGW